MIKSGKSELNGYNVLWLRLSAGSLNAVANPPISFFDLTFLGNFSPKKSFLGNFFTFLFGQLFHILLSFKVQHPFIVSMVWSHKVGLLTLPILIVLLQS